MIARDPVSADRRRKEKERVMIKDGTDLWKRKKLQDALEKREDQRKLQTMLASYHPWGRPGGGAPNLEVRRQPLTLTLLETKKGLDTTLPRFGPKPPVFRRSDPLLRYQFHEPLRRSIENHVRYRRPYQEQIQYKQQLDRLVADKRRQLAEQRQESKDLWNMSGWTGEPAFQRMEYQHVVQDERRSQTPKYPMLMEPPSQDSLKRREIHPPEEVMTGGVELVPLLARRRAGYKRKDLSSTDVTRVANDGGAMKPIWKPAVNERNYLRELSTQIVHKEMKLQEARSDDIVESKRHFETWGGFWGRPGHGAPKSTGSTAKENLEYLLYRMPIVTM